MLRSTVFTQCFLALAFILMAALPTDGRRFSPYNAIERAAGKALDALTRRHTAIQKTRRQSYAPADPAYQADVVAYACHSVISESYDQCTSDMLVHINYPE